MPTGDIHPTTNQDWNDWWNDDVEQVLINPNGTFRSIPPEHTITLNTRPSQTISATEASLTPPHRSTFSPFINSKVMAAIRSVLVESGHRLEKVMVTRNDHCNSYTILVAYLKKRAKTPDFLVIEIADVELQAR